MFGGNTKPSTPKKTTLTNRALYIDKNPDGALDHLTHAKSLLSQVYYRQNMYVMSAQYCDAKDLNWYLGPIIALTGFASFCGFLASSALISEDSFKRNFVSLLSGFLGVIATTITSLRNSAKYDVKAEMFRGAAGQYRLLATRLEERMRKHRMSMNNEKWETDKEMRENAIQDFNDFFEGQYRVVLTAQSEMKYFPPVAVVRKWKEEKKLLPSEVDQPEVDRSDMAELLNSIV
mmetsp:Transcript_53005/g.67949  ORF Transcript_53005/g.67949 Transcript_53005/m.67949 type:complete len:233 (+) Transcript_53005:62-760(+)